MLGVGQRVKGVEAGTVPSVREKGYVEVLERLQWRFGLSFKTR